MTHHLSSLIHRNLNPLFCEIKPYLNPLILYYLSTVYKSTFSTIELPLFNIKLNLDRS